MTTHAVRISPIRWAWAEATTALFGPDHPGANDTTWLQQIRDQKPVTSRPVDTATAILRRPAAAITAEAHREIHDPHLGVLRIAGQVPAHLYNALTGGAR